MPKSIDAAALRRRIAMAGLGLVMLLATALVVLLRSTLSPAPNSADKTGLAAMLERHAPPAAPADLVLARLLASGAVVTGTVHPAADGQLRVQLLLREPGTGAVAWQLDESMPRAAAQALFGGGADR